MLCQSLMILNVILQLYACVTVCIFLEIMIFIYVYYNLNFGSKNIINNWFDASVRDYKKPGCEHIRVIWDYLQSTVIYVYKHILVGYIQLSHCFSFLMFSLNAVDIVHQTIGLIQASSMKQNMDITMYRNPVV